MKNYYSLSVSRTVSQSIMRVYKPKVEYKSKYEQNMAINSAITRKPINWGMVAAYNECVIWKIQKLRNEI